MTDARAPRGAQGRIGAAINGKWQIDARIGSGGMATVYAATHRNGHRAAIKMLHANLSRDASTRARFLREGYVANAVGHPGVVAVLDDGVAEDGSAFLVLELLEGETVEARRLRQGGKLSIEDTLLMADDALAALAAAHAKGIVHRDVKPENVFLTKDGETKLLDFGLARMKELNAEVTQTGVTLGTPEFMPPEQAMGLRDAVDARSDLWALGATIFTALAGRHVHDAQTVHEQLIASATRRPQPIREIVPSIPPALAKVIDRALEIEMGDRWQTADEMRAALRGAREARARRMPDSETITNASPLSRRPRAPVDPNEHRFATETTEAYTLPPQSTPVIDFDETHAAPPPVRSNRSVLPDPVPAPISARGASRPAPAPSNRPSKGPPPLPPALPPSNRPPAPQATTRMRAKVPLAPEPPPSNSRSHRTPEGRTRGPNNPTDGGRSPTEDGHRRSRPAAEELMPASVRRSRPPIEELFAPVAAGSNRSGSNRHSYPPPEELADPNATFPPNSLPPPSIQPMNEPISYGPRYSTPPQPQPPPSGIPVSTRTPAPASGSITPMLYVLAVLVVLCTAMGAYVLSRGPGP